MDWTQAFTIIGIIAGFFVFMMNRMDSRHSLSLGLLSLMPLHFSLKTLSHPLSFSSFTSR